MEPPMTSDAHKKHPALDNASPPNADQPSQIIEQHYPPNVLALSPEQQQRLLATAAHTGPPASVPAASPSPPPSPVLQQDDIEHAAVEPISDDAPQQQQQPYVSDAPEQSEQTEQPDQQAFLLAADSTVPESPYPAVAPAFASDIPMNAYMAVNYAAASPFTPPQPYPQHPYHHYPAPPQGPAPLAPYQERAYYQHYSPAMPPVTTMPPHHPVDATGTPNTAAIGDRFHSQVVQWKADVVRRASHGDRLSDTPVVPGTKLGRHASAPGTTPPRSAQRQSAPVPVPAPVPANAFPNLDAAGRQAPPRWSVPVPPTAGAVSPSATPASLPSAAAPLIPPEDSKASLASGGDGKAVFSGLDSPAAAPSSAPRSGASALFASFGRGRNGGSAAGAASAGDRTSKVSKTASPQRRRCCSVRAWFITAVVAGLLIVLLVPVGYIYWPRFPEIRVLNLTLSDGGQDAYSFTVPANASNNLNYMSLKIRLNMQVAVYNPNVYGLDLEKLDINAILNCNKTELDRGRPPSSLRIDSYIGPPPNRTDPNYEPKYDATIGQATRDGGGLNFPSRTNVTFAMNFTLEYTPDRELGLLKDPVFGELLQVCGVTRSIGRPARVSYDAVSSVKALSRLGYYPRVASAVLIRCPATDDQINAVITEAQKGSGKNIIEILQEVFKS
ncbi:hypothetical protein HDU96_000156 [Phlyctochytrium bullatum]|nr:hypothetical protein HDU96_000156 [Phlyctochytrium bullatum]